MVTLAVNAGMGKALQLFSIALTDLSVEGNFLAAAGPSYARGPEQREGRWSAQ